jgi:hypothetical protein
MYEIKHNLIFYLVFLEISKHSIIYRYKTTKKNSLYNKYMGVVEFHMYLISPSNIKIKNHLIFMKKIIKRFVFNISLILSFISLLERCNALRLQYTERNSIILKMFW